MGEEIFRQGLEGSGVNEQRFPPRIHAIIARDKNVGIVIRRGPSKHVATFLWDLNNDTFKIGQWLKGKIYARRCDISRDGKYFLYFAMADKRQRKAASTWTALSRAPYLKALDFYPKGDAWEGGGLFLQNRKYFLNDRYYLKQDAERRTSGLECVTGVRAEHAHGAECLSIYFPRLIRDGWIRIEQQNNSFIFEKPAWQGWTLRKISHAGGNKKLGGSYWDEHQLESSNGKRLSYPDWEWADVNKKTIIFAENGKLFRVKLTKEDVLKPKALEDFSKYTFEPIQAPY